MVNLTIGEFMELNIESDCQMVEIYDINSNKTVCTEFWDEIVEKYELCEICSWNTNVIVEENGYLDVICFNVEL